MTDEIALERPEATGMFRSLQHPNFRLLMSGFVFAQAGAQMAQVTQGWLVYDLTNSAFLLGAVGTVTSLPMLIFTPLTGVIVDRLDRRRIIMVTHSVNMVAMFVLATLILTRLVEVWHVFAYALIFGAMQSFYNPARQAMIPELVGERSLMNAIAVHSATIQFTRIIGPSIAGALLVYVGIPGCFYSSSLAFAIFVAALFLMSLEATPAGDASATIWQNLKEGLAYVVGNRTVVALLAIESIPAIFGWQYQTLMPIFARDILAVGPSGLGLLMSAAGAGALVGALALAALDDFRRKGLLMLGSATVFGVMLILFAISDSFPASLVILVLIGGTSSVYAALVNVLIQVIVPNELRGRILSFYMLAFGGMMPFGSLQAGVLASSFGAPATLVIGGVIVVIFSIAILIFMPRLRQL